ncbi:MAG: hypothetical protein ACHQFX_05945 [Chitinophagales bacterium]
MKYLIVPFVILSIFTGIGCLNNANQGIDSTGPVPTIVSPQTPDSNTNKFQTNPATTLPPVISNPVSAVGLNPAHGQPGHRCEIAVGAPLDSKPAQTTTTTSLPTPPVATTAALNPAHGQPGHRCEIAVGAPLDSKPAQPTTTTSLPSPPVATSAGLNPAHGQPGHRCEIAVGAPLDSKPTQ